MEERAQAESALAEKASTPINEETQPTEYPWARFAGMYQANPLFDDVLAFIQACRHALDEDETVI
ncbi:MAG: hypothetical protein ACOYNY_13585 [Caldilineaceae bacterium]